MALQTIQMVEKNVIPLPAAPVNCPDSVSTLVLPNYNLVANFFSEISSITIQNTGGNVAYIAFGQTASNVSYHKVLQPGQELSIPLTCEVYVWSAGGTSIAPCVLRREGL